MSSYDLILKKEDKKIVLEYASIKGERGKPLGIASHELLEDNQTKIVFDDEKGTTLLIPPGKDGHTPQKGIDYNDGYTPVKGKDYFDGEDGTSPIINAEPQKDKVILKILDKEGEKELEIPYGKDGYTPQKGVDYFDGYTPQKGVDYFDGKDGVVTIDNLSDEELQRFKDLIKPGDFVTNQDLDSQLKNKANVKHNHEMADVTGLSDALDKIKNDTQSQLDISKKNYDTAIANIQKETQESISRTYEETHEAIINIRSETNSAIADSKKYLDTQIAIIQERFTKLEDELFSDITANPFTITFDNLSEINLIAGVYNASNKQLEC